MLRDEDNDGDATAAGTTAGDEECHRGEDLEDDDDALASEQDDDDYAFESMDPDDEAEHGHHALHEALEHCSPEFEPTESFVLRRISCLIEEARYEWFCLSAEAQQQQQPQQPAGTSKSSQPTDAWNQLQVNSSIEAVLRVTANHRAIATTSNSNTSSIRHWTTLHEQLLDLLRNRLLLVAHSVADLLPIILRILGTGGTSMTSQSAPEQSFDGYSIAQRDRDFVVHLLGLLSSRYLSRTNSTSQQQHESDRANAAAVQRATATIVDSVLVRLPLMAEFLSELVQMPSLVRALASLVQRALLC